MELGRVEIHTIPNTNKTRDRHGPQGLLEGASNAMLENEFGTSKDDEAVLQILEKGSMQEFEV